VLQIASLYDAAQTTVYAGEEASEARFKRDPAVSQAFDLHFAAHNLVDEEEPTRTGLLLSPGRSGEEDGFLTLDEIFNRPLAADLVVLSACSTALGKRFRGEGLVGLTWAFLYAGASSLVVSLWDVEDDATAALMVDFYRAYHRGESKSQALQGAKLKMLGRSRAQAHPSRWAPFILVGRWR
jgi:CHAT domain-containing protein